MVFDRGPFQFQLMLSKIRQQGAVFEDMLAGYAIASYRIGHWTPFVGYSQARSNAEATCRPPAWAS